jgi:hypothetical protein
MHDSTFGMRMLCKINMALLKFTVSIVEESVGIAAFEALSYLLVHRLCRCYTDALAHSSGLDILLSRQANVCGCRTLQGTSYRFSGVLRQTRTVIYKLIIARRYSTWSRLLEARRVLPDVPTGRRSALPSAGSCKITTHELVPSVSG